MLEHRDTKASTRDPARLPLSHRPVDRQVEFGFLLDRLAARLLMGWGDAAVAAGAADRAGQYGWPSLLGIWASQQRIETIGSRLGLPAASLRGMLLNGWSLLLPDDLDEANSATALTRSGTFRLAGTAWCPLCVSEGTWRIRWRLAWVHSCADHERLLAYRCPGCGQRGRSGSQTAPSWRRAWPSRMPMPGRCDNRIGSDSCGHSLASVSTPAASPSQVHLDELLAGVASARRRDRDELIRLWDAATDIALRIDAATARHSRHRDRLHDPAVAALAFEYAIEQRPRRGRHAAAPPRRGPVAHAPMPHSAAWKLPMMLWTSIYREWFTTILGPDTWMTRRHASTLLVRHLDGCSLQDAARRLGWQSASGYYRLRNRLTAVQIQELDVATSGAAKAITPMLPDLIAYGQSRMLLADRSLLTSLDVRGLGFGLTGHGDDVSAWVWSELTGGPPAAWSAGPAGATRCTTRWRAFLRSLDAGARRSLDALTDRVASRLGLPGLRPTTAGIEAMSMAGSKLCTGTSLHRQLAPAPQRSPVQSVGEAVADGHDDPARSTTR